METISKAPKSFSMAKHFFQTLKALGFATTVMSIVSLIVLASQDHFSTYLFGIPGDMYFLYENLRNIVFDLFGSILRVPIDMLASIGALPPTPWFSFSDTLENFVVLMMFGLKVLFAGNLAETKAMRNVLNEDVQRNGLKAAFSKHEWTDDELSVFTEARIAEMMRASSQVVLGVAAFFVLLVGQNLVFQGG